jgi:hypothetical protein
MFKLITALSNRAFALTTLFLAASFSAAAHAQVETAPPMESTGAIRVNGGTLILHGGTTVSNGTSDINSLPAPATSQLTADATISINRGNVAYTLLGDANLDGAVNGSDFAILASNFDKAVSGWNQGDFNYDGAANGSDFATLAASFNQGANQSGITGGLSSNDSSPASIPEPATASLLAIATLSMLRRRRTNI